MSAEWQVVRAERFDRQAKKLRKKYAGFSDAYAEALLTISDDPRGEAQGVKTRKLRNIAMNGNGQWRFKVDKFRFRYDIIGDVVLFQTCFYRSSHDYKD